MSACKVYSNLILNKNLFTIRKRIIMASYSISKAVKLNTLVESLNPTVRESHEEIPHLWNKHTFFNFHIVTLLLVSFHHFYRFSYISDGNLVRHRVPVHKNYWHHQLHDFRNKVHVIY